MEWNTRRIFPARRRAYRQYISSDDDMIKEAASMTQVNPITRQRTPAMLLIKQPKALKQYQTSSFLREAVRYLVYKGEGKLVIEAGLREIDHSIKSIAINMCFIGTRSSLTTTLALHFVQDQNQDDVSPVTTRIKEDEDDGIFHRTRVKPNLLSDISQFSSTLKHSIDKANADTILELLQHKHDHLAQGKDGWCALDYAARTNNEDVCRTRIRSECLQTSQQSIDTYNHTGATPLQFAVSIGRLGTVRVLLEAAANPHATDHYQRSPLFIASEGNHLQVTEFLLSSRVQIPRDATAWLKELLCETNWCNRCSTSFHINAAALTAFHPGYGHEGDPLVRCVPPEIVASSKQAALGQPDTSISLGPLTCPDYLYTAGISVKDGSSTLAVCCPSGYIREIASLDTQMNGDCLSSLSSNMVLTFGSTAPEGSRGWIIVTTTLTTSSTVRAMAVMGWNIDTSVSITTSTAVAGTATETTVNTFSANILPKGGSTMINSSLVSTLSEDSSVLASPSAIGLLSTISTASSSTISRSITDYGLSAEDKAGIGVGAGVVAIGLGVLVVAICILLAKGYNTESCKSDPAKSYSPRIFNSESVVTSCRDRVIGLQLPEQANWGATKYYSRGIAGAC
ncbi:hypothetical protein G4B11_007069 [Aspergillus flavus]|nr:hypothetical protein G4B11_007069 [Aspergillus flavus]